MRATTRRLFGCGRDCATWARPALPTQSQGAGRAAHDGIVRAIERVLADGPRTPDLGGKAHTEDVGAAIAELVAKADA